MRCIMSVETRSYTYTDTRIDVIEYHFQLFLRNGGMTDDEIDQMTDSILNKELEAVGIYAEDNEGRILEVEFLVDWDEHNRLVERYGFNFDTNIPGWKDKVSPEAHIAVRNLVRKANKNHWQISSWIRVASKIRSNPSEYQKVADKLGYGGTVPNWKKKPQTMSRKVQDLEEATVTQRSAIY